MKRSGLIRRSAMPVRKAPLRRSEPRRTPRLRVSRGTRILPDAVAVVKDRSGGVCEIQLAGCWTEAVERSHRIARGAGGVHGEAKALSDRPSDLLDSCVYCHLLITLYAWRPDVQAKHHGWVLTRNQEATQVKVLYRGEWKYLGDKGEVDPECGCCEISDYSPPEDEFETACENCGHSPEEHEPDF